jgi:hypothetical protein
MSLHDNVAGYDLKSYEVRMLIAVHIDPGQV